MTLQSTSLVRVNTRSESLQPLSGRPITGILREAKQRNSTVTLDEDFGEDFEDIVASHQQPWTPPACRRGSIEELVNLIPVHPVIKQLAWLVGQIEGQEFQGKRTAVNDLMIAVAAIE